MQLTSKGNTPMIVEFRPHNILSDKFVYTLKFKGEAQSMRLMSRRDMIRTVNSRIEDNAYQVTDFLTEPQAYSPASCWLMSLIKTYLHNKMISTAELDQLKSNYAEMIVEGMDMDTLITFAVESIEENLKDWDWDDVTEEIRQNYDEETLISLLPDQSQPMTEVEWNCSP